MEIKKLCLYLSITTLVSCGGGSATAPGSNSPGGISHSGKVMDGYLVDADVFLDLNANGEFDSGEPHTTTDSSGAFVLTATQNQIDTYPIYVNAVAGKTIDLDNPGVPITRSYSLVAQPKSTILSPLTTGLYFSMVENNINESTATSQLQNDLNLAGADLNEDYVANARGNSHKIAAATVSVLQGVKELRKNNIDMLHSQEKKLIKKYLNTLIAANANNITSAANTAAATAVISSKIFVNSVTYSCSGGNSVELGAASDNSTVFMIDPTGTGDNQWGEIFTVPVGSSALQQYSLYIRNVGVAEPAATKFKIEIYAWNGSAPDSNLIYTSLDHYFISPNTNTASNFGTRPFVFDINTNLTSGNQYIMKIVGDGSIALDTVHNPNSTAPPFSLNGATGYSPGNGRWFSWHPMNFRSKFCFN